ncbi:hypothetical protein [Bradyrhizobium elkanii]|uniref:hypothetical protein n=1 Tax=Bradyrhizobium elkanii TaxID=29448 RepID=UPI00084196C4|nr:hypothetical protein [Bradyrhizobium elkanii]ODM71368.1 hypothetical protein A6452_09340 [Bradyrhizobium elkanii]ODM76117.1 hypothetical protein A6X20_30360 [Bradyrhizobium elkanii]
MHDPNYYIALCARRYAEVTRQLALTDGTEQRNKLIALLQYLKQSAIQETAAEVERWRWRLPDDIGRWTDHKAPLARAIAPVEAEVLRGLYAVPGGGVLGTLSSAEMALLADLYEGWSCTAGLDRLSTIRTQGFADGMRSMADFVGPDHVPHDPPADSIHRFLYEKAFLDTGKRKP